jgi:hypothetical protein
VETQLIKFGHGLFGVLKGLFLSAFQKLGALRIKGLELLKNAKTIRVALS